MKLLYKFASRSRPEKFFNCLDNITSLARHDNYEILCSLDVDDTTMVSEEVKEKLKSYKNVTPYWGISKSKIDAINRDIGLVENFDILLNHSDDMWFIREGFDIQIISDMQKHFPDGDGVLHYPDGIQNEKLISYSIMDKKFFDRFGYIYNTEYTSLFCDNEFKDVAEKLKRYAYIDEHIFEHRHPVWGYGPTDELLQKTEGFYNQDQAVYQKRKQRNFDL